MDYTGYERSKDRAVKRDSRGELKCQLSSNHTDYTLYGFVNNKKEVFVCTECAQSISNYNRKQKQEIGKALQKEESKRKEIAQKEEEEKDKLQAEEEKWLKEEQKKLDKDAKTRKKRKPPAKKGK